MTDKDKNNIIREFTRWKKEGLDIDKYHCLIINFGANMMFEYPHIRRVIMIFS